MKQPRLPLLYLSVVALLLSLGTRPQSLLAQEPIFRLHNHPQKTFYQTSAEWPFYDLQCHAAPQENPADPTNPVSTLGHVHIGLHAPVYAEISGRVAITGELKMFKLRGRIDDHFNSGSLQNVVFDNTGTSVPGILRGDPNGLIVQTFRAELDPVAGGWPLRGWVAPVIILRAFLDNGIHFDTEANYSFYSVLDPTAPETNVSPSPDGAFVAARCIFTPPVGQSLATQATEARSFLPVSPIDAPWPVSMAFYTYGSSFQGELAPGFTEISLDANLHMGIEGTQIFTNTVASTNPDPGSGPFFPDDRPYQIDPALIGSGAHSLLFRWKQPTGAGSAHFTANEESWSLMLIPVSVGTVTPPPPNPCVTDPLQMLVSITGINHPVLSWTGVVTGTDDRGCMGTVSR